jgi:two pore calcium channel protein 1
MLKIVCCIALTIDVIVHLGTLRQSKRVLRVVRSVFLIDRTSSLMNNYKLILGSAVKVLELLTMTLMLVLAYSAVGYLIMTNVPGDKYFLNFYDSFVNMFILLTTVNFPDVMLPSYQYNHAYVIFFVTYLFQALYFLLNLSLAITFSYYKRDAQRVARHNWKKGKKALLSAFKVIDNDQRGYIDYPQWRKLFMQLKPHAEEEEAKVRFYMLDSQHNGQLRPIHFLKVDKVLSVSLVRKKPPSPWKTAILNWKLPRIPIISKILRSKVYQIYVHVAIIITTMMSLYIIASEHSNLPIWSLVLFHVVDMFLLLLSAGGIVVDFMSVGPRNFFKHKWHIVNALIVMLNLFTKIMIEFVLQYSLPHWIVTSHIFIRVNILSRMFRFARLFCISKQMRIIAESFIDVWILMFYFLVIMFIHFYVFSIIGMESFAGLLVPDNPDLVGTDFGAAGYAPTINFNSWPNAMLTLFHLMVVNNWHVCTIKVTYHLLGYCQGYSCRFESICHYLLYGVLLFDCDYHAQLAHSFDCRIVFIQTQRT